MLSLSTIQAYYPAEVQHLPRFMLREYLQYKILKIIYDSEWANYLGFMGGTALRIIYGNQRFSEDLDFDNRGLDVDSFENLGHLIKKQLEREGCEVNFKMVVRGAWHYYLKLPEILFESGLTHFRTANIVIRVDTEPQDYSYRPEQVIINKFEVFTTVLTLSLSLLLAQKLFAIINRKRKQGRDFYDVVFLMSRGVKPDYAYLKEKVGISDATVLKASILEVCKSLDMERLAADVEPFLINIEDKRRVLLFPEYWEQE